jgi:hypothetical protein
VSRQAGQAGGKLRCTPAAASWMHAWP